MHIHMHIHIHTPTDEAVRTFGYTTSKNNNQLTRIAWQADVEKG